MGWLVSELGGTYHATVQTYAPAGEMLYALDKQISLHETVRDEQAETLTAVPSIQKTA